MASPSADHRPDPAAPHASGAIQRDEVGTLDGVRLWRFAVPADHPDGISGELPMRYTRDGGQAVP